MLFESLQAGPLPVPKLDPVSTLRPSHSSMKEKNVQKWQGAQPRSLGKARLAPSDPVHALTAGLLLLQEPEGNI